MAVVKQFPTSPPPVRPVRRDVRPLWTVVLSGVLLGALLFTVGWYVALPHKHQQHFLNSVKDIFPGISGLGGSKTVLIMGVDVAGSTDKDPYKGVRTDTMMLVRLNPDQKQAAIVSIPRDSKVYINGSVDKINAAFAYGGADRAVETVEKSFGVHVDNYLVANLHGVKDFVDAVGGIDIYMEKAMHYDDHTAKLAIHFEPGLHHLNGKQTEGFLRFRHDALGDIGRIRRQQLFLNAFAKRMKNPTVLWNLKPLLEAKDKYVLTDMSMQDLVQLALFAKDMGSHNMQVATMPGRPSGAGGVSYWVIDQQQAEKLINQMIMGINTEPSSRNPDKLPTVGLLVSADHKGDVEALKERLTEMGYKVSCEGTARGSVTRLISHRDPSAQALLAGLVKTYPQVKNAQMIYSPHGSTFESNTCGSPDFTVIIGDDVRSLATR